MVWCKPSILDKLDNQNHAVTHWIYRGVLASFILPRLLNVTTQILTCERTVLATPGKAQKSIKQKKQIPCQEIEQLALTLKMPIRSENPKNLAGLGAEAGAL